VSTKDGRATTLRLMELVVEAMMGPAMNTSDQFILLQSGIGFTLTTRAREHCAPSTPLDLDALAAVTPLGDRVTILRYCKDLGNGIVSAESLSVRDAMPDARVAAWGEGNLHCVIQEYLTGVLQGAVAAGAPLFVVQLEDERQTLRGVLVGTPHPDVLEVDALCSNTTGGGSVLLRYLQAHARGSRVPLTLRAVLSAVPFYLKLGLAFRLGCGVAELPVEAGSRVVTEPLIAALHAGNLVNDLPEGWSKWSTQHRAAAIRDEVLLEGDGGPLSATTVTMTYCPAGVEPKPVDRGLKPKSTQPPMPKSFVRAAAAAGKHASTPSSGAAAAGDTDDDDALFVWEPGPLKRLKVSGGSGSTGGRARTKTRRSSRTRTRSNRPRGCR